MRRIVVAFPPASIRQLLQDRRNVVFFDENGWSAFDASAGRRVIDSFAFDLTWSRTVDVSALITTLKSWSDVWCRWVAHADHYELLLREALVYVLHVQEALRQLEAASVVFCTSIPHHIDSSLLQIACAELRVPQIFLYCNNVTMRLHPLTQVNSVADRVPSRLIVSDYDAGDDIRRFIETRVAGRRPRGTVADRWRYRSFACGVVDACYVQARQRAARLKRSWRARGRDARFLEQFEPLALADHVRIMARQRRGIEYFRRRISTDSLDAMLTRIGAPALLIAAHFQPEATTFPEGGDIHNHIDLVTQLRSLGYRQPVIYKEHPSSLFYCAPVVHQTRVGIHRSEAYYRRLEELGCLFLDPASPVPLDAALNERFAPVSMTGSIAVERSLAGLPTVVTGHPWYKGLPGTAPLEQAAASDELRALLTPEHANVAADAAAFLDRMLSGTTIVNAPGIGTAEPLDDLDTRRAFAREFGALVDQLSSTPLAAPIEAAVNS